MISVILTIASMAIISAFCIIVKAKIGYLPNSLSESYYRLNELDKSGWMFQVFLAASVITLIGPWVHLSADSVKFLAFLSCGATLFVAGAPRYENYTSVLSEEDIDCFDLFDDLDYLEEWVRDWMLK